MTDSIRAAQRIISVPTEKDFIIVHPPGGHSLVFDLQQLPVQGEKNQ